MTFKAMGAFEQAELQAKVDRQAETIAEQLQTIVALNDCIGGEGSLTTDNLVLVGRLETEIEKLNEVIRLYDAALSEAFQQGAEGRVFDLWNMARIMYNGEMK